jgi:serine phosphatase RsbU (regulator of sigma subunit)
MGPGDVLVVYSDGITDATTVDDEPFGEERLRSVIADKRGAPARTIVTAVLDAVTAHAGDAPQFDDLTVLVVKRTG